MCLYITWKWIHMLWLGAKNWIEEAFGKLWFIKFFENNTLEKNKLKINFFTIYLYIFKFLSFFLWIKFINNILLSLQFFYLICCLNAPRTIHLPKVLINTKNVFHILRYRQIKYINVYNRHYISKLVLINTFYCTPVMYIT